MKASQKYVLLVMAVVFSTCAFVTTSIAQPPDHWQRDYDQGGFESFRSVVATDDGGYAALTFKTLNMIDWELELTKLDRFGDVEWVHTYAPNNVEVPTPGNLVQTPDGGFSYRYVADDSQPLVHVDQFGREQWRVEHAELGLKLAKRDGGGYVIPTATDSPTQLQLTYLNADGSIDFQVNTDSFSGNLGIGGIEPDGNGNYYVFCSHTHVAPSDAMVYKYDNDGNQLWVRYITSFDFEIRNSHGGFVTEDGGCVWYGSGHESTGLYFFVWGALAARIPADGGPVIWSGSFEQTDDMDQEGFYTGVQGADGINYLAGDLSGDPVVLAVDSGGNELWRYIGPQRPNFFPQYYYFGATFDHNEETLRLFGQNSDEQTDALLQVFGQAEPVPHPYVTFSPVGDTVIPPYGGTLHSAVHIENSTMQYVQARARRDAWLPSGTRFPLDNVQLNLAPGQVISLPDFQQQVPPGAPAGEYVHNLTLFNPADEKISSQAYFFHKEDANLTSGSHDDIEVLAGWQHSDLITAGSEEAVTNTTPLPLQFAVGAAYPNPFNSSARVSITLPNASNLSVQVFNNLGRKVAELANGQYSAGAHEPTWNPSELASGIYFMRVNAGGEQAIRKLAYMK